MHSWYHCSVLTFPSFLAPDFFFRCTSVQLFSLSSPGTLWPSRAVDLEVDWYWASELTMVSATGGMAVDNAGWGSSILVFSSLVGPYSACIDVHVCVVQIVYQWLQNRHPCVLLPIGREGLVKAISFWWCVQSNWPWYHQSVLQPGSRSHY